MKRLYILTRLTEAMNVILKLWKKLDNHGENSIAQTLNYLLIMSIATLANDEFYCYPSEASCKSIQIPA